MFPLSDQATIALWAAGVYLASAGFFVLAGRHRLLAVVPVIGLAAWAIVRFSEDNGGGGYEGLGDIVRVLFFAGVVGIAAFFTCVAHLVASKAPKSSMTRFGAVLLVIVPAFLIVGSALLRQYVPDAPCSTVGIPVEIGHSRLHIPVEFAPRIEQKTPSSEKRAILLYKQSSLYKEDVHRLCRLTRNGRRPIRVEVVWLTPVSIQKTLDRACTIDGPDRQFCRDLASAHYGDMNEIRLTTSFHVHWGYLRRRFVPRKNSRVQTGGDRKEGFVCWTGATSSDKNHCNSWRPLDDETMILVKTGDFTDKSAADLLAEAQAAVAYTLQVLLR
jgi:hypothetical protein